MNKIMSIIAITVFSVLALSCSDDHYAPNADVKSTFKAMYPKATFVEWETELGYVKAEFRADGKEKDAWFEANGAWVMTETDLRVKDLPAAITKAISESDYANWKIDDVDYLEYADQTNIYVVDVEKKGQSDVELFYSPDGTLIKIETEEIYPYHRP